MEFKRDNTVRFYGEEKQTVEATTEKRQPLPMFKPPTTQFLKPELGIPTKKSHKTRLFKLPRFGGFKVFPENFEIERDKILDPGGDVVLQWNRVFLFWCLVALYVDPLFFFLSSVKNTGRSSCMTTDLKLGIVVTFFRTLADLFYVLHIFIKFRTAYVSRTSRVFGRGELVKDPKLIARRYLRSDFIVDLIACLPLPQIVSWFILPSIRSSHSDHTTNALVLIVLVQYIPRLYLIFPLSADIIKATGVVTTTAWAGAAYNLLQYMLASHILGAAWYLLSIERQATCWKAECHNELVPIRCVADFFDCGAVNREDRKNWQNVTVVFSNCDPSNNIRFTFGIFADALTKNVVSSPFLEKYLYCLWFGLQNLSSYGQNLDTSTSVLETMFAILVAIFGLVLFALLIGNMQTYLQSITVRLEEWRLKRRDTEEWMGHRQLPQNLRERVRRFVQYKWLATRGVDEETILHSLPADLRRDIQRHLCLDLVRRVPLFAQMDDQLLDAICERLVSSLSTQGNYIVREGDPVTEMLFIIRGKLESSTTNGGRTGFFNSITLKPGEFCGEELLAWALLPKSKVNLPSSTRTVRALEEVEAFALQAEDLKFVANQFRRLHSKKLQHTFRYYSHQWRTWAACFVQVAWRRYKRRMLAKSLSLAESYSSYEEEEALAAAAAEEIMSQQEERQCSTPSSRHHTSIGKPHFAATVLASRFAKNTRRASRKMKDVEVPMLPKPEEPDFSVDAD
ncbi:putative cyclic nucleotide-gated ion channel 14 [Raphanus sativus]|uniref:Probable cyclic nucleotide-gated ion channel 14 n=1 Tax=Raphanus sativus TaxID=3726 RepID=A0A6J0JND3_RAPSA|nr:probable cyclic nucleotide-gated ion channel 14 [Raphanus sativus]KAJ4890678.1 putative cyclic nucleotide-gated ion channel 14 [Raphanus sativus]